MTATSKAAQDLFVPVAALPPVPAIPGLTLSSDEKQVDLNVLAQRMAVEFSLPQSLVSGAASP